MFIPLLVSKFESVYSRSQMLPWSQDDHRSLLSSLNHSNSIIITIPAIFPQKELTTNDGRGRCYLILASYPGSNFSSSTQPTKKTLFAIFVHFVLAQNKHTHTFRELSRLFPTTNSISILFVPIPTFLMISNSASHWWTPPPTLLHTPRTPPFHISQANCDDEL